MNDTPGKTMSSLVVAEKKHQKPAGGCVGVFFHLFDWNRKLSKKKLFSNKLLPAVKPKQLAKKFGNEKLPMAKLLLIADENRGGFPSPKKPETDRTGSIVSSTNAERNKDMRAPGLVARLMGLEAMPARDVPERNSASLFESQRKTSECSCFDDDPYSDKQTSFAFDAHRKQSKFYCYNRSLNKEKSPTKLESLSGKVESRPQKLQKTGFFERRAVTRFQGEALPFKKVISHSRKHHQKLVSPVKSPRILSGKNAVRLMEAASKILEPRLQATRRAKCALTYSASSQLRPREQDLPEEMPIISRQPRPADVLKQSSSQNPVKSLKGQSSCKSLENLLDVVGFRSNFEQQESRRVASASSFGNSSTQESVASKPQLFSSSSEQERDAETPILVSDKDTGKSVITRNQDRAVSLAVQAKANVQRKSQLFQDRKPQKDHDQCSWNQQCRPQQGQIQKVEQKNNQNRRQNQILTRDNMPQKPKLCSQPGRNDPAPLASLRADNQAGLASKDRLVLQKNLNDGIRNKKNIKVLDGFKEIPNDREGSATRVRTVPRKKRPIGCNSQVENAGSIGSAFLNGRNAVTNGKETGLKPRSINRNCVQSMSQKQGCSKNIDRNSMSNSKEMDVVSFTFTAPMKHDTQSFSSLQLERKKTSLNGNSTGGFMKNLDPKNGKLPGSGLRAVEGDALSVLLEQKLREVTCLDEIELSSLKDSPSGRSTASLLQELLSALSAERPISQEHDGNFSYNSPTQSECSSTRSQTFTTNRKIQRAVFADQCSPSGNSPQAEKTAGCSIGFPLANGGDHHSPVSILEASFSSESCLSSHSLESNLVDQLHLSPTDCSLDKLRPLYADADLSDSATSTNTRNFKNEITDATIDISAINATEIGLTGSELDYVKEVISNAELLFENVALYDSDGIGGSIIDPLLFEKLETVADALWRSPKSSLGFVEAKNRYQFRKFLFDCMVECLDLKYSHYCRAGFKAWAKLPLFMCRERLSRDVYVELRRWRGFAGKMVDEIIEREMSSPMGKWTDFEIEAFEAGIEIESKILQILVDEIVVDLLRGRTCP